LWNLKQISGIYKLEKKFEKWGTVKGQNRHVAFAHWLGPAAKVTQPARYA
jgi:hypothetical protein